MSGQGGRGHVKKIFILGFPHSGTSILKRVIGNVPEVHEHPYETNIIKPEMTIAAAADGKKAIVIKDINCPWLPSYAIPCDLPSLVAEFKVYLADNASVLFIMVIKNPADIFGSLNRRFGEASPDARPPGHQFVEWETWAAAFSLFRSAPPANLFTIRYEDFFTDRHSMLSEMFGFLDLPFDPSLLQSDRSSMIVESIGSVPNEEPSSRADGDGHGQFRTWQINQPFRDMTGESAIYLDDSTRAEIAASVVAKRLGYAP